ncbi:MAG: hypothetical protein ABW092_18230 [Candidatus Thiodiazotropha sp.]
MSLIFNPFFFVSAIVLGLIYGYYALPLNRKILSENMPEVEDRIFNAEKSSGYGFFFDKELLMGNLKGIKGVKDNRGQWYLSLVVITAWYLAIVVAWVAIVTIVIGND